MAGPAAPAYHQTPVGPVYTREGQAFLRDREGKIVTVAAGDAARLLDEDPNYFPVSAEDVASRDVEIARSTLGNRAAAFAENAVAGAVDVPLIPIRAGMRAGYALGGVARDLAGKEQLTPEEAGLASPDRVTGRAAVEQGIGGLAEATGSDQQEAGAIVRQYRQDARERRDVLPGTSGLGTVAGQLPYAFVGPGAALGQAAQGARLGVRLGAQALGGAVEGAAYGESQATDDAYIEDKPLTAEKLIASMGWGSLIGGAAGGGLGALGEGFGAARSRLGRSTAREAVSDESAQAFGASQREQAQTAAVQGGTDARIADAADSAGLNPAARREAARGEAQAIVNEAKAVDPTDWRGFTKNASNEAQYLHRDTVLRAASNETADGLTKVLDNLTPIYNDLDNLQIKRGRIAERLAEDNVDQTAVIGRAQQETAELRARIAAAREQTLALKTELATVGGDAGPVAPLGKGKGAKSKLSSAEIALNEMDSIARNHETRILQATNGADAIGEYDSLRRELAKVQRKTASAAPALGEYEARSLMGPIKDFAHDEYMRAAANLWDETWVGAKNAAAQKSVNNARVSSIRGERYDLQPFVVRVGDDADTAFGGQRFVGNQDAIKGLFESLGPGGGGARADQFARFVDSTEATLKAIRDNHAVGAAEMKRVDSALAELGKMRSGVNDATNAANKVNLAKAAIEADQIGGGILGRMVSSTALGGIEGGAKGAARGFARGLMGGAGPTLQLQARLGTLADESKLAAWLENKISKVSGTAGKGAAVVNQTASRIDTRVGSALDGYFDRVASVGKKSGMGAADSKTRGQLTSKLAPIATRTALQLFTGGKAPDAAYRERTEQLLAMDQNMGQGVRDRTTAALGGVSETAPRLTQHVAVTASRGVSYLLAHTPVPLRQPSVMQPSYRPIPSDLEIAEFAKRWAAVADPLTVLEDFQRGMVTYEQVDALKNVYPSLYRSIQVEALQRFQKLDQAGIPVPYQDRLQADLMFDLHGAGDPTLDPGFALKVSGMMQAAQQKNNSAPRGSKPVNVAKSYVSDSQAIGATLRGVS